MKWKTRLEGQTDLRGTIFNCTLKSSIQSRSVGAFGLLCEFEAPDGRIITIDTSSTDILEIVQTVSGFNTATTYTLRFTDE